MVEEGIDCSKPLPSIFAAGRRESEVGRVKVLGAKRIQFSEPNRSFVISICGI